jgi:putative acetyltransferase
MSKAMEIRAGGLDDPRVLDLLKIHLQRARAETAPGSAHALDLSGLRLPDVSFYSVWEGDRVVGMGALKRLAPEHYEIKSMHTTSAERRRGMGSKVLLHLIAEAHARGAKRLSLETGTWDYFRPAVALYRKFGFVECEPFGDYVLDPNSVFLTLELH